MGTFSFETAANRHNSDKFETVNPLKNDLIWLLLHSWFSKFFRQRTPGSPYNRYTWKHYVSFLITPLLHAEDCIIMIQIIGIYLLSVCDCQILKTMIFFLSVLYSFVACDHDSPPHFFSPILLFSNVRYQRVFFCWKRKFLLIKQILYWLVINCLKFYWLLIC